MCKEVDELGKSFVIADHSVQDGIGYLTVTELRKSFEDLMHAMSVMKHKQAWARLTVNVMGLLKSNFALDNCFNASGDTCFERHTMR